MLVVLLLRFALSLPLLESIGNALPFYYPRVQFGSIQVNATLEKMGRIHLAKEFPLVDYSITDEFIDQSGVHHLYAVQTLHGYPIANHHSSAHSKDGRVHWTASFTNMVPSGVIPTSRMSDEMAIAQTSEFYNLTWYQKGGLDYQWVAKPDGSVVFTISFQLRNPSGSKWFLVHVNAETGVVEHIIDFVHRSSYRVVKPPNASPDQGFSVVQQPEYYGSSPMGWQNDGTTLTQDLTGNNAQVAYTDYTSGPASPSLDFTFCEFDPTQGPTSVVNKCASSINAFYILNWLHDVTYLYGFNESAGNFQVDNMGKGGKGNDPIATTVQNLEEVNDAYFAVSADGHVAEMYLFFYDFTNPHRDSALANDIIIHEFSHGMVNRMVGGPSVAGCLATLEAQAIDEGFSDAIAMILLRQESDNRTMPFVFGQYLDSSVSGLRTHAYSSDRTVNSLQVSDFPSRANDAHAAGEIWASLINEVYWEYVHDFGVSGIWWEPTQHLGNVMALRIIIGGMLHMGCNPTFEMAREGMRTFIFTNYEDTNSVVCPMWRGFASRGLGAGYAGAYVNDYTIPEECNVAPK